MSERYEYREEEPQETYSRIRLLGGETTPSSVPAEELRKLNPYYEHIMTTDFTVSDVTTREPIRSPGGVLLGFRFPETGILSIDHHFDDPEMRRPISSTNLAIQYIQEMPRLSSVSPVQVTHIDADSALAAAILAGYLQPEERYGEAAIAADHTGEENEIADLLMALDPIRDVNLSLSALNRLLKGEEQLVGVQELVDRRKAQRERAQHIVERDVFEKRRGGLHIAYVNEPIPGEFLPALLPEAKVIATALLMNNGKWEVKVRAGMPFPEGRSLHELELPGWGGRWNAGSTKRGGGIEDPESFLMHLEERLSELS